MAAWQLASIMNLKKNAYYTNNVSSNKGGMKIVLGQFAYQNNNELLEWKVEP
jgi:hypothetical protein